MKAHLQPLTRPIVYISILLVACLLALAFNRFVRTEPTRVSVTMAKYEDVNVYVNTMGKVVPVDDFEARANFPGIVDLIAVHLGDRIHPGQLLVRMKDPFARQRVLAAKANLISTEVGNENVQMGGSQEDRLNFAGELARAQQEQSSAAGGLKVCKKLQALGAASDAEVYAAEQRVRSADVSLSIIQQRISHRYSSTDSASWKARVADAHENLNAQSTAFKNANITSPIAGTAYLIPANAYDFVPVGADLLHVADLSRVQVRAYFDEPDIGKLHNGEKAEVKWDGRPGRVWHGTVLRAPLAAVALGIRNVGDCTIAIEPSKEELLPNTNVSVTVTVQENTHVLSLPREALHTDGNERFVYRIIKDTLVATPVEVGTTNLDRFEVRRGVSSSDVVALHTGDNSELKSNLIVKVIP